VLDTDADDLIARSPLPSRASAVDWVDRRHVLVSGPRLLGMVDIEASRDRFTRLAVPRGGGITGVAVSGAEGRLAVTSRPPRQHGTRRTILRLGRVDAGSPLDPRYRRVFTGLGRFDAPVFSPDGEQVLLPWRSGNQWQFFDASRHHQSPLAIGDIARQFDPGTARDRAAFPRVGGWCCG
jgi:hypothetical protein